MCGEAETPHPRVPGLVGAAGLGLVLAKALAPCTGVTRLNLASLLGEEAHPDVVFNDSVCDEWCHKALCCDTLLDNTEIRRYVLLSNVCLNI